MSSRPTKPLHEYKAYDRVQYKSRSLDTWYRATVLYVGQTQCVVRLDGTGVEKHAEYNRMRPLYCEGDPVYYLKDDHTWVGGYIESPIYSMGGALTVVLTGRKCTVQATDYQLRRRRETERDEEKQRNKEKEKERKKGEKEKEEEEEKETENEEEKGESNVSKVRISGSNSHNEAEVGRSIDHTREAKTISTLPKSSKPFASGTGSHVNALNANKVKSPAAEKKFHGQENAKKKNLEPEEEEWVCVNAGGNWTEMDWE
ncbi:hypothetical protein AAMO2058_001540900 [Amorphochlora amoebiformis]